MALKICDLFAGAGGFSWGFKQEGFEILGAIDVNESACRTYKTNISNRVLNKDITEVYSLDFLDYMGQKPDIVIASPPCEGFSEANAKRARNYWDRLYTAPGNLTIKAIEWIQDLEPSIGFIIENVPAIAQGELKMYIINELKRIGYDNVYFNLIRSEKLGSPSKRPRMFISNMMFKEPSIDQEHEFMTVWDAIGDLPEPSDVHDIPGHFTIPLNSKRSRGVRNLKWFDSLVSFQSARGKNK
ncbi:MAG: DNA cytosine methyltransferase, partial [Promethearchaeota archaeon]